MQANRSFIQFIINIWFILIFFASRQNSESHFLLEEKGGGLSHNGQKLRRKCCVQSTEKITNRRKEVKRTKLWMIFLVPALMYAGAPCILV